MRNYDAMKDVTIGLVLDGGATNTTLNPPGKKSDPETLYWFQLTGCLSQVFISNLNHYSAAYCPRCAQPTYRNAMDRLCDI